MRSKRNTSALGLSNVQLAAVMNAASTVPVEKRGLLLNRIQFRDNALWWARKENGPSQSRGQFWPDERPRWPNEGSPTTNAIRQG